MRISTLFIFLLTACLLRTASAQAQDGLLSKSFVSDNSWELMSTPYHFAAAGWGSPEIAALTRVEAVRMGLDINQNLDERFDPVKGKMAAASFRGFSWKPSKAPKSVINLSGAILLSDLAQELGKSEDEIKAKNPHFTKDIFPKGAGLHGFAWKPSSETWLALTTSYADYQQKLQEDYEKRKKQLLSFQPDPETHDAIDYTVRSGDFLGQISSKMGVGLSDLRKWNQLKNDNIYPGQKLIIWVPSKKAKAMQEVASAPAEIPKEKEEVPQEEIPVNITNATENSISYKVKSGDTLWSIARQFPGVSTDNIQAWNKVDGVIKPGEILKIYTASIRDYSPENYPSSL
ncbi:MAG: hypothetical protein DA405_03840 [Bacteroidetes bacterium]|nr:MAG: hypothetical protein DA405_03840 [Bacteroidota bacterium]